MDLGVRQIRTAGKGSGSIELTLPADLRDLVGLPCRITLRDGSRPDIVLQPDLRHAQTAFASAWQAMAAILLRDDSGMTVLPLGGFGFGLQPRFGGGELPFLCWRDGLALAAGGPHDPGAVSRTLSAIGHGMAALLHIDPGLATSFGAACGYVCAGVPACPEAQEACDLAAAALRLPRSGAHGQRGPAPLATAGGMIDAAFWRGAEPLLAATADLFLGWTADPSSHAALRLAWRRGRALEMSGD